MKGNDTYVFADYLRPGYHQLLIFDPLLERAYCKDFMLNINLREDLFPEYPILHGMKVKSRVKDVFEKWKDDRFEDVLRSFSLSREISDDFNLEKLVKDEEDREKTL